MRSLKTTTTRAAAALIAAAAVAAWVVPAADAASIVYLKSGNVWLSTPDGSQGYQLTFSGGWDSPSQADDGTIMALKGGQTYRLSPSGSLLGTAVPTIFHGADPTTSQGPFGVRISPDGTKQSYYGEVYTSYDDFSCGCTMYRWEAVTRWGAANQFSEPNQTRGQELYGEPTWVDGSTVMLTNIGSVFGKQVALYTVGGGDNSLSQWFSDPDPSVKQLQFGTITRAGDILAFVASTQNPQDQIRLYQSTGPYPSAPNATCGITGASGGQFSYLSFSPDGSQLAWQDAAGVHVSPVSNLNNCSTITDQLILPGATEPYFGPANVNMSNAPTPPAGTAGGGTGGNPGATGGGRTAAGGGGSAAGTPAGTPPTRPRRKTRGHKRHRRHRRHHQQQARVVRIR